MKDYCIQNQCRVEMLNIFRKLSNNDLIRMYNILHELDLQGFALSFCIEILEERGLFDVPKKIFYKQ